MRARPGANALVVVIVATVALVTLTVTVGAFVDDSAAEDAEAGPVTTSATTTTEMTGTIAATTPTTTSSGTTSTDDGPPESARLVARYPASNGSMVERTLLTSAGVARVDPPVNDSRTEGWQVPMTLTPAAADRFSTVLVDAGFTEDDAPGCPTTDSRNDEGYCVLVLVDGEPVSAFELGPRFSAAVESGAFADDPRFVLALEDHDDARDVWRGFLEANTDTTTASSTARSVTETAGTAATTAVEVTGDETTSTVATTRSSTESSPTPGFDGLAVLAAALLLAVIAAARRDDAD